MNESAAIIYEIRDLFDFLHLLLDELQGFPKHYKARRERLSSPFETLGSSAQCLFPRFCPILWLHPTLFERLVP
jgi:hypothetical protein